MAYNGSGNFTPNSSYFPVIAGALIESAKFNGTVNDIASGLSTAITKDGQTTITDNLPMAGFRHTGVGDAATRTDYASTGQVQDSAFLWAGTAGGTGNAITLTLTPAIAAYAAGQSFTYKSSASANTGAMTVAVSGLATKAIQKNGAALVSGDHPANRWFRITYDGAAFQLEQITVEIQKPVFSAYANSDQSISSGTWTKVTLGTEDFDSHSCFSSSRFTPNVAGYYQIQGSVRVHSDTLIGAAAAIFKNGSQFRSGDLFPIASTNSDAQAGVSCLMYLNGSSDYVELFGQATGGTPKYAGSASTTTSHFSGYLVRSI